MGQDSSLSPDEDERKRNAQTMTREYSEEGRTPGATGESANYPSKGARNLPCSLFSSGLQKSYDGEQKKSPLRRETHKPVPGSAGVPIPYCRPKADTHPDARRNRQAKSSRFNLTRRALLSE